MASIAIFLTQHFSDAAGLKLASDGTLTRDGKHVLKADVRDGRISVASHYEILDFVARETPDRAALSIRYAKSLDVDTAGTLGLALKAAVNLRGVLQRYVRYYALFSESVVARLQPREQSMFFDFEYHGGTGPGLVFSSEAGLSAFFMSLLRVAAEPIRPTQVTFKHDPPQDAHLFKAFFGCDVLFGQSNDGILFSEDVLDTPNRLGDTALSEFLDKHLDQEIENLDQNPSLIRSTKKEIARLLSEGPPNMAQIAQGLGFSARSFHRRLSEHGVNFQTLAEETRRDIALGMLGDAGNTLSEIAFLTGFSEQSSFNRAFKRWTGQTPAKYRREMAAR